jgi:hypothetical protein
VQARIEDELQVEIGGSETSRVSEILEVYEEEVAYVTL